MKNTIMSILAVALAVMLLVSLVQIRELHQQIGDLQSQFRQQEQNMDQRIGQIEQRVEHRIDQMLQEQQKVFHSVEWTYGEVDYETMQVDVIVTAVPKSFSPESSEVRLSVNGASEQLSYEDGAYVGRIPVELLRESYMPDVQLIDAGTVQVEQLEWIISPRYDVLLNCDTRFTGGETGTIKGESYFWHPQYAVEVFVDSITPFQIQSMEIVAQLNGQEIDRIPVDLSDAAQTEYLSQAHAAAPDRETFGSSSAPAVAVPEQTPGETGLVTEANIIYFLDQTYEIPADGTLILFAELVDQNGLRYRNFIDCCVVDSRAGKDFNGEQVVTDQYDSANGPEILYDSDGAPVGTIGP